MSSPSGFPLSPSQLTNDKLYDDPYVLNYLRAKGVSQGTINRLKSKNNNAPSQRPKYVKRRRARVRESKSEAFATKKRSRSHATPRYIPETSTIYDEREREREREDEESSTFYTDTGTHTGTFESETSPIYNTNAQRKGGMRKTRSVEEFSPTEYARMQRIVKKQRELEMIKNYSEASLLQKRRKKRRAPPLHFSRRPLGRSRSMVPRKINPFSNALKHTTSSVLKMTENARRKQRNIRRLPGDSSDGSDDHLVYGSNHSHSEEGEGEGWVNTHGSPENSKYDKDRWDNRLNHLTQTVSGLSFSFLFFSLSFFFVRNAKRALGCDFKYKKEFAKETYRRIL